MSDKQETEPVPVPPPGPSKTGKIFQLVLLAIYAVSVAGPVGKLLENYVERSSISIVSNLGILFLLGLAFIFPTSEVDEANRFKISSTTLVLSLSFASLLVGVLFRDRFDI
jgi:hypothetical protein